MRADRTRSIDMQARNAPPTTRSVSEFFKRIGVPNYIIVGTEKKLETDWHIIPRTELDELLLSIDSGTKVSLLVKNTDRGHRPHEKLCVTLLTECRHPFYRTGDGVIYIFNSVHLSMGTVYIDTTVQQKGTTSAETPYTVCRLTQMLNLPAWYKKAAKRIASFFSYTGPDFD